MRKFQILPKLAKVLNKLQKKDKKLYLQTLKKMKEVLLVFDVSHYKNLKYSLSEYKRVHVKNSFVLVFKYSKSTDVIIFCKFKHHDKIY